MEPDLLALGSPLQAVLQTKLKSAELMLPQASGCSTCLVRHRVQGRKQGLEVLGRAIHSYLWQDQLIAELGSLHLLGAIHRPLPFASWILAWFRLLAASRQSKLAMAGLWSLY